MNVEKWLGKTFIVRCCPECDYIGIGPDAAWHAFDCSAPDVVEYVAQIQGPRTLGKVGK